MGTYWIEGNEFSAPSLEPGLYLAATPIGNLGDVTLRVLKALAAADVIACEDTRVTRRLLSKFAIGNRPIACHAHNERQVGEELVAMARDGKSVVYASDAGMPIVSDPGQVLVKLFREAGLPVTVMPGASAPVTAIAASGMDTSNGWFFAGFLPSKAAARRKALESHSQNSALLVFFESPNRLIASLKDMSDILGDHRHCVVARELTKLHEEILSDPLGETIANLADRTVKGEVVVLVEGNRLEPAIDVDALLRSLLKTHSVSRAASEAADLTGKPKRQLYQAALKIGESK